MGREDSEEQNTEAHFVLDLQDTNSDYFEKSHEFSESERSGNDEDTNEQ